MIQVSKKKFLEAVGKFSQLKVLVLGDLILDKYLFGKVTRISPEAPVPIVNVYDEKITLGGAGNVIKNLSVLGLQLSIISKSGDDENSKLMSEILLSENINKEDIYILKNKSIPTIIKTRVIAGNQQVCRIDQEKIEYLSESEEDEMIRKFNLIIGTLDGVIISDYDKGALSKNFISHVILECKKKNKIVTVDPQVRNFFEYRKATILTPNHLEAGKAIGKDLESDEAVEAGLKEILHGLDLDSLMITRGSKGMSLIYKNNGEKIHHIPTVAKQVFDVTGAGDTVISIYTAFLCAGMDEVSSAILSNFSAGIVVGKLGASTCSVHELQESIKLNLVP